MELLEFAAKMMIVSQGIDHALQGGVEDAAMLLENSAKGAIGTYEFGWAPLAASTLARKSADTPLFETGQLQASIEHTVGKAEAWVGSSDRTALWHELGTSKMPAHPFMGGALAANEGKLGDAVGTRVIKAFVP